MIRCSGEQPASTIIGSMILSPDLTRKVVMVHLCCLSGPDFMSQVNPASICASNCEAADPPLPHLGLREFGWLPLAGACLTYGANIIAVAYDFESDALAIV